MAYKEFLSGAAIVLTFVLFVPYVRGTLDGRIRPHMFSWIVWGVGTFTVFFAQLAGGAGIGAWPIVPAAASRERPLFCPGRGAQPASGRVMIKAGMKREGELVDELLKDGAYHTLVLYGLIKP